MGWKFDSRSVAAVRAKLDLSQEQFAQLCGMTQTQVSALERGRRVPSCSTLLKICNATECPPRIFFAASSYNNSHQEGAE